MTEPRGPISVTIIGGGASGVLLAAHLLRDPDADVRVTLVERSGQIGLGLAYSTNQPDHKLNVPARNMSAFADDPEHFWRWLQGSDFPAANGSWVFAPRRRYGAYLEHVLREAAESRPGRLLVVSDEAVAVRETANGVETQLSSGKSLVSVNSVLALGHETQQSRGRGIAVRLGSQEDTPLPPHAPVMILGSGLSMVDAWLSLANSGHRGAITVVSRNSLVPRKHKDVPPIRIDEADIPFGAPIPKFLRWFRDLVRQTEAANGDWRSVVDGLRPYNQRVWQSWSIPARRQFLRHLRPWWNVHRHRLPPELHDRLSSAIADGQIRLVAAEFQGVERVGEEVRVQLRRRGAAAQETLDIARIYDCGGVSLDVRSSSNPVIQDLVASGRGRSDPLHIGLDVDAHCAVLDRDGKSSERLLAMGPLTRGQFFEIEAVPDIRLQAARLAERILAGGNSPQRTK